MERSSHSGPWPRTAWLAWALGSSTFLHFWARTLADPDMWGHLEWGRDMVASGRVTRVDRYSYTAAGRPFFDHEWLADVGFAALFDAGGPAALLAMKLVLGLLVVAGILDAMRALSRRLASPLPHPMVVAAVMVLALAVIAPGATFRPQLVTMAALALEWSLLERATLRLVRRPLGRLVGWELWAVPALLVPWANLHGGFVVGVGLMGLFCVAALVHLVRSGPDARAVGSVVGAGALTLLAPLVNPYGIDLYVYLARTLAAHGPILEWHPVSLLGPDFARFKLLVLATAVTLVARRGRLRSWDALWRLGFLALAAAWSFRHQRHTVLFAIVAAPVLAVFADDLRRTATRRWPGLALGRTATGAVGVGIAMVVGIQLGGLATTFARHGVAIRFTRAAYPVDAIAFLEAHGFSGNVAVPFDWGSYTVHKLGHQTKIFIDGRFEAVYPPEVIRDYLAFVNGRAGWERLLDVYPTDIVVTHRLRGTHARMFERSDFVYVYSDPAAFVFVRRSPRTGRALDRLFALARRPMLAPPPAVFP